MNPLSLGHVEAAPSRPANPRIAPRDHRHRWFANHVQGVAFSSRTSVRSTSTVVVSRSEGRIMTHSVVADPNSLATAVPNAWVRPFDSGVQCVQVQQGVPQRAWHPLVSGLPWFGQGTPDSSYDQRCAPCRMSYSAGPLAHHQPEPRSSSRRYKRTRRSSCAFSATMIVLRDMNTAPTAGVSTMPHGASTPAASGIATML